MSARGDTRRRLSSSSGPQSQRSALQTGQETLTQFPLSQHFFISFYSTKIPISLRAFALTKIHIARENAFFPLFFFFLEKQSQITLIGFVFPLFFCIFEIWHKVVDLATCIHGYTYPEDFVVKPGIGVKRFMKDKRKWEIYKKDRSGWSTKRTGITFCPHICVQIYLRKIQKECRMGV